MFKSTFRSNSPDALRVPAVYVLLCNFFCSLAKNLVFGRPTALGRNCGSQSTVGPTLSTKRVWSAKYLQGFLLSNKKSYRVCTAK